MEGTIKVPHPEYGVVKFTRLTRRQLELVESYNALYEAMGELLELERKNPNDEKFGGKVREVLKELRQERPS